MNSRPLFRLLSPLLLAVIFCASVIMPRQAQAEAEVSFSVFYDTLAPYGNWVHHPVYGQTWVPLDMPTDWRPYTDGQWAHTDDYGWLWVSDYSWGWVPFHYGRWAWDIDYGWLWVPGYIWSPAWVFWRSGGGYAAWAAMPPNVLWQPSGLDTRYFDYDRDIRQDAWVAVHEYDLPYQRVRERCFSPRENPRIIQVTKYVSHNVTVINNTFINVGVPVRHIERVTGRPVRRIFTEEGREHNHPHRDGEKPFNEHDRPHHDGEKPFNEHDRPHRDGEKPFNEHDRPHHDGEKPFNEHDRPHHDGEKPFNEHDRLEVIRLHEGRDANTAEQAHREQALARRLAEKPPINRHDRPDSGQFNSPTPDKITPTPLLEQPERLNTRVPVLPQEPFFDKSGREAKTDNTSSHQTTQKRGHPALLLRLDGASQPRQGGFFDLPPNGLQSIPEAAHRSHESPISQPSSERNLRQNQQQQAEQSRPAERQNQQQQAEQSRQAERQQQQQQAEQSRQAERQQQQQQAEQSRQAERQQQQQQAEQSRQAERQQQRQQAEQPRQAERQQQQQRAEQPHQAERQQHDHDNNHGRR
jgi:DNA segregation ATPase FtsK/SpoIIIE-like protein